jgi:hypothetical protein
MQQSACQPEKRATHSHAAIWGGRAAVLPKELRARTGAARDFLRLPPTRIGARPGQAARIGATEGIRRPLVVTAGRYVDCLI